MKVLSLVGIACLAFCVAVAAAETPTILSQSLGGVQLWENGPYWAECNVGASKPEEYGYYFWWGDTVGYRRNAKNNGWKSVKDGTSFSFTEGRWFTLSRNSASTYKKSDFELRSLGYIDSTGNLAAAHDAATVHLGAPWRMPTDAEMEALVKNCAAAWVITNGVHGLLVTGLGVYASSSIFLPAAGYGYDSRLYCTGSEGYYWSSTPYSGSSYIAWYLNFTPGDFYRGFLYYRYLGQPVRPVRGFAQ